MCRFCETTPPQTVVCVQLSDDCAEPPEIIGEILCDDDDVDPQHLYGIIGTPSHIHFAWIDWFGVEPVLNVAECDAAGCDKASKTMLIKYCPLCNRNLTEVK